MPTESKAAREAREEQERIDALAVPSEDDAQLATVVADSDVESFEISVPGEHDELVFTRGVDEIARFKVTDGKVKVSGEGERALVLSSVAGAELV